MYIKLISVILFISVFFTKGFSQIDPQDNCENALNINIASSSEIIIVLSHPGFFIFPPGADQQNLWEISTTSDPTIVTFSDTSFYKLDLPEFDLSIEDSIIVDLTITNTDGNVCFVKDTAIWTVVSTVPLDPPVDIYGWKFLDSIPNFGTFNPFVAIDNYSAHIEELIKIYPNPSQGIFTISGLDQLNKESSVEIYNNFGQKVSSYSSQAIINNQDIESSLSTGIYFLIIKVGSEIFTKKIIINN